MCYKQNVTAEEEVPERREGREGRDGGKEGGREGGVDELGLANKMYQHAYLSEESLKS